MVGITISLVALIVWGYSRSNYEAKRLNADLDAMKSSLDSVRKSLSGDSKC
jgi:hypothetical protein